MKQRLLSICTALCLCLTLLPAAAWAAGNDVTSPPKDDDTAVESGGGDTSGDDTASDKDKVPVDSWETLKAAIEGSDAISIILQGDVKCEADITILNNKNLIIYLGGYTLTGAGGGSVITVQSGGTLAIQNSDDGADPDMPGTITGGSGEKGGGIYVADGGTVTIQDNVKITGNTAANGGGIYIENGGKVTIQDKGNVEITGNEATGLGGGVYNAGAFTMEGGAIHGNSAREAAADFYSAAGSEFTLFRAEGCSWYKDEAGQRYDAGCWNPYEIQGTESYVTEVTHLAAVQLEGEGTEGAPIGSPPRRNWRPSGTSSTGTTTGRERTPPGPN